MARKEVSDYDAAIKALEGMLQTLENIVSAGKKAHGPHYGIKLRIRILTLWWKCRRR